MLTDTRLPLWATTSVSIFASKRQRRNGDPPGSSSKEMRSLILSATVEFSDQLMQSG
jgi:hypothetical protein